MRIAVYPGTFDPVTRGHQAMVLRALPLFDKLVVAVGHNAKKKTDFSLEQRIKWLEEVFEPYPSVEVASFDNLTVQFCREIGAQFILRGLRSSTDFEFERNIAQANKAMEADIETVFIVSEPGLSAINSSIVRDIFRHGGDVRPFIPEGITLAYPTIK
jgi:pantetheine-phosphate adenylyltransferase